MLKKIIPNILLWAIVAGVTACSYMADYIEGEITNRASFSISARYVASTGVIVEWNVYPNNDSFAGYEIYMTQEPNNEFADYIVVGARFAINIRSSYFQLDTTLENSSTSQFIHSNLPSPGIYFYRVGVIEWDEHDYDEDGEDDTKPSAPSELLYESYTKIVDISGSAMVEIQ